MELPLARYLLTPPIFIANRSEKNNNIGVSGFVTSHHQKSLAILKSQSA